MTRSCDYDLDRHPCRLISYDDAVRAPDPLLRLAAHALGFLTANVPAFVAAYALLDYRTASALVGPIVIDARAPDAPTMRSIHQQLVCRAEADPLTQAARRQPLAKLLCTDTLAGTAGYSQSVFAAECRHNLGIGPRLRLVLRDRDRVVASIALMRRHTESDFSDADKQLLLKSHDFLQAAHRTAIRTARAERNLEHLARTHALSPQEHRVAGLVAAGASSTRIAEQLTLTPHAVQTHVRTICTKLQLQGQRQLAAAITAQSDQRPPYFETTPNLGGSAPPAGDRFTRGA